MFLYRLAQLEKAHSSEVERLQHSLQQEAERRHSAEKALQELRGDVSIGMEDIQPVATAVEGQRMSFGMYCRPTFNTARKQ